MGAPGDGGGFPEERLPAARRHAGGVRGGVPMTARSVHGGAVAVRAPESTIAGPVRLGLGAIALQAVALAALVMGNTDEGNAWPAALLAGVVLAAVLWTAHWLTRGLERPLGHSGRSAARMSAGDLTSPVDTRQGGEIRELVAALE